MGLGKTESDNIDALGRILRCVSSRSDIEELGEGPEFIQQALELANNRYSLMIDDVLRQLREIGARETGKQLDQIRAECLEIIEEIKKNCKTYDQVIASIKAAQSRVESVKEQCISLGTIDEMNRLEREGTLMCFLGVPCVDIENVKIINVQDIDRIVLEQNGGRNKMSFVDTHPSGIILMGDGTLLLPVDENVFKDLSKCTLGGNSTNAGFNATRLAGEHIDMQFLGTPRLAVWVDHHIKVDGTTKEPQLGATHPGNSNLDEALSEELSESTKFYASEAQPSREVLESIREQGKIFYTIPTGASFKEPNLSHFKSMIQEGLMGASMNLEELRATEFLTTQEFDTLATLDWNDESAVTNLIHKIIHPDHIQVPGLKVVPRLILTLKGGDVLTVNDFDDGSRVIHYTKVNLREADGFMKSFLEMSEPEPGGAGKGDGLSAGALMVVMLAHKSDDSLLPQEIVRIASNEGLYTSWFNHWMAPPHIWKLDQDFIDKMQALVREEAVPGITNTITHSLKLVSPVEDSSREYSVMDNLDPLVLSQLEELKNSLNY